MKKLFSPQQTKWYGWKPDLPDPRDYKYQVRKRVKLKSTNNWAKIVRPPILDQGNLGSCTGHGTTSAMNILYLNGHVQDNHAKSPVPFSRLQAYYNGRLMEGTVNEDSGCQIRDVIKQIAKLGVCSDATWPYNITQFAKKPSKKSYKEALHFPALVYKRLDNSNLNALVDVLSQGFPFIFGFTVFDSFESDKVAKTGIVSMPNLNKESMLGGHCVYAIDYDAKKKGFWCVNSWGTDWGKGGRFFMPQAYLTNTNLSDDFWVIELIK